MEKWFYVHYHYLNNSFRIVLIHRDYTMLILFIFSNYSMAKSARSTKSARSVKSSKKNEKEPVVTRKNRKEAEGETFVI